MKLSEAFALVFLFQAVIFGLIALLMILPETTRSSFFLFPILMSGITIGIASFFNKPIEVEK